MEIINPSWSKEQMWAIAFDLDTKILEDVYDKNSPSNAYKDIWLTLKEYGFNRQQGSVYFSGETITEVQSVVAVQHLAKKFSWFSKCIKDIRLLRVAANSDLMPAIDFVIK